jgi:hypothetical protein
MKYCWMLPDFPTIIADESVDGRIIQLLQGMGYILIPIAKVSPGLSDNEVIEMAKQNRGIYHHRRQRFWGLINF